MLVVDASLVSGDATVPLGAGEVPKEQVAADEGQRDQGERGEHRGPGDQHSEPGPRPVVAGSRGSPSRSRPGSGSPRRRSRPAATASNARDRPGRRRRSPTAAGRVLPRAARYRSDGEGTWWRRHRLCACSGSTARLRIGRGCSAFLPHLAGSSVAVPGSCLAGQTPWLYFGFAVPDRTGGQIKESAAQEPIRIGPPGSLRPLTLTHTT